MLTPKYISFDVEGEAMLGCARVIPVSAEVPESAVPAFDVCEG
jgi:hypothetical protein